MLVIIFFFNIFLIFSAVIIPGLKIVGVFVKSIIVDSKPILHCPPSSINLIFLPNSSTTSLADVGLNLDEIFALGAANGTLKILRSFLATLCLGILTAIVFFFAVAIFATFEFFFLFKI